jgi:CRP/FNR family cyclic AMP-dependent transcriptional regulator
VELSKRLGQDAAFGARFYKSLAIFLSDRLRVARAVAEGGTQAEDEADEIDPAVLETLTRAGARFDRMLHELAEVKPGEQRKTVVPMK